MTEPTDVPPSETSKTAAVASRTPGEIERAERTVRLAKALRDNLRRRKAVPPKRDKPGN